MKTLCKEKIAAGMALAVSDGSNAVKEVYTRGPDLSGSLDGAGGIGGILAVTDSSSVVRYSHADIMGNVIALTDASGSVVSTFRYTPFGQLSARTGTLLPRYLFSSKEFDRPANLYYYGYRYYAPRLGRWMTRDPLEEDGGENLHEFSLNNPCSYVDSVGEMSFKDLAFSSIGWDKAWPFPPDGQGIPVGLGGARIQVFVYSTGSFLGCCNRKTGKKEQWFSVTLGIDAYVIWGYAGKTAGWRGKSRDRNKRGPDGVKNKNRGPSNHSVGAFRERSWHADFSGVEPCPEQVWTGSLIFLLGGVQGRMLEGNSTSRELGLLGMEYRDQTWTFHCMPQKVFMEFP